MGRSVEKERDDPIVLGILNAVDRDAGVTQRSVASELGIAVGLANAYVKRCARKGLIKVSQAPARRYAYYLTPKGFAEKARLTAEYLSDSLSFFRHARLQYSEVLQDIQDRGGSSVVLVGDGDLADIARLVSRDFAVRIVATVPLRDPLTMLAETAGQADAYVITSMERPADVYTALVAAHGEHRVHAPALLRARPSNLLAKSGRSKSSPAA